jgi:hypothetical protein
MQIEKIFYIFGTIFAISAILYFTWEYLLEFPDWVKSLMLLCASITLFFVADAMRGDEL